MVEAYNFLASWQLFPEKGSYEFGNRPKSGFYKIELGDHPNQLYIAMNWVSIEDQGFSSSYQVFPNGELQPFDTPEVADSIKCFFIDSANFETHFYKEKVEVLVVKHDITPKGYLRIVQERKQADGQHLTNVEIYHKQMSVLPYSASVSGAVIKPNEAGVIRHQALTAMEEQTNMQLVQIRQQIELLAIQAKEIQQRKELSMLIYDAKLNFSPVINQVYYLYENKDGTHILSMVAPKEWGKKLPFKSFVASVKLLADHTWKEI
jgi:hypothetical protein